VRLGEAQLREGGTHEAASRHSGAMPLPSRHSHQPLTTATHSNTSQQPRTMLTPLTTAIHNSHSRQQLPHLLKEGVDPILQHARHPQLVDVQARGVAVIEPAGGWRVVSVR